MGIRTKWEKKIRNSKSEEGKNSNHKKRIEIEHLQNDFLEFKQNVEYNYRPESTK